MSGSFEVRSPFDGRLLATLPLMDRQEVDRRVQSAAEAFEKHRETPAFQRAAWLDAIADGVAKRRAIFAMQIVAEAGKPITLARGEVDRAVMTFRASAGEARSVHGELLPMDGVAPGAGHFGFCRRFPVGVVAGMTPFNFPLNLVAHKVGPALASGNAILIKPSPKTPLTAMLLEEVLREAGVPEGLMQIVLCDNQDAVHFAQHPEVAVVSFTGSAEVGWKIKGLVPKKKVVLELGGNAAVIVDASANLEAAVPMIATGAFSNAGQSCISVQRIYVHESALPAFRSALLAEIAEKIHTGDPVNDDVLNGPLIDRASLERVSVWVEEARGAGAQVLCGGRSEGSCYLPTVIEEPGRELRVVAEEVFGPVCTLHAFKDFGEAITRVNDSRYGLQAGIFTANIDQAIAAYHLLEAGAVLVNQVPTYRVESMPYGGGKDSGFGREGVRYAMEEMTGLKSLIIKKGS